jgi:hypothetical protein
VDPVGGNPAGPAPRSFSMGFTPFPHAFSVEAVEAAYDVIARDADMIVQHFDDGVPWQEALGNADNATTCRDTYAVNLLNDLDYKLQHNPAGHSLYLAVTPLGPMREGLALCTAVPVPMNRWRRPGTAMPWTIPMSSRPTPGTA